MTDASPPPADDRLRVPPSGEAARVVRALRRYATESDLYVTEASRDGEMHRTDLNGLALVMDWGLQGEPATPGRLSAAMHLSAPATSAMLERLERQGHVTRGPHPDDRRSVVVSVTEHALAVGSRMFGTLAAHLAPVLESRSEAELAVIATFLEEVEAATVAARLDVEHRSSPARRDAAPGSQPPAAARPRSRGRTT